MPINVKVDFKGFDRIGRDLPKAFEEGLNEAAEETVRGAQETVHVITGTLRDSIRILEKNKDSVVVGTDLDYAAAEEFGNSRRPAHPYLGPQGDRMKTEAPRIIQAKVNKIL